MIETEEKKLYNEKLTKSLPPEQMDTTVLAYIGDAVYELFIREYIINKNRLQKSGGLHKAAISYVKSGAQAMAVRELEAFLTEEEKEVVRRARNKKSISKAKNSSPIDYKLSTAFEALIGYLYMKEEVERAEEVMRRAIIIIGGKDA